MQPVRAPQQQVNHGHGNAAQDRRNGCFLVEANDMGAVRCCGGQAFVAGPYLNICNAHTLKPMFELGAKRWVMPYGKPGLQLVA